MLQSLEDDMLAVGSMNNISVYSNVSDLTEGSETPQSLSPPHYDRVTCLARCGRHLISGSRDLSIKRWDCSRANNQWAVGSKVPGSHEEYVTALVGLNRGQAVMSGSVKGVEFAIKNHIWTKCV